MNKSKQTESSECIVIGLGQLGQLYGGAALRLGMRVTPVTRHQSIADTCERVSKDSPIVVAVGEGALNEVAREIPVHRRKDAVLVQNEIFMESMNEIGLGESTLSTVWLSKKKQRPIEIARVSCAYGPHADWFRTLHQAIDLPMECAADAAQMERELIAKYTFILTINVLGLVENITLGQWLEKDAALVESVAVDALGLAEAYAKTRVQADQVLEIVREAMHGLAHYPARGRTAQQRLDKAIKDARQYQVDMPGISALKLSA